MTGESVTFNFIPVQDWVEKARCRGMDPNIFMPEPGDSTAEIKEICNGKMYKRFNRDKQRNELVGEPPCPVRGQCLQYAMELPGKVVGIFGGTSEKERRALRSEFRMDGAVKRIPHGTLNGYKAEWRFGMEHCQPCLEANAEATRRNKAQAKSKVKHGTYAGYRSEKRLGLPICEACQQAYEVEKADYLSKTTALETDSPLRQVLNLLHSVTTADWPIAKDIASEQA
jgi:hypothetical protein